MNNVALKNLTAHAEALALTPHPLHGDCGASLLAGSVRKLKRNVARHGFKAKRVQREFLSLWQHSTALWAMHAAPYEEEIALAFFKHCRQVFEVIQERAQADGRRELLDLLKYVGTYLDCAVTVARRAVAGKQLALLAEVRMYQINVLPILGYVVQCYHELRQDEHPVWSKFLDAVQVLCTEIKDIIVLAIPPAETTLKGEIIADLRFSATQAQLKLLADLKAGTLVTRRGVIVRYWIPELIRAAALVAEGGCHA